jgi:hypothetical protein
MAPVLHTSLKNMAHMHEATDATVIDSTIPESSSGPIHEGSEEFSGNTNTTSPTRMGDKIKGEQLMGQEVFSIIPPTHEQRTLVLCFDGTGDQFDADNTNVVNLCSMLKKDEKEKQMVYYQVYISYTTPASAVNVDF